MLPYTHVLILLRPSSDVLPDHVLMLHAEPFETHLLSAELCILFIYFLKGNCIGLEYHIILSKIHIIVIIKTKIIDKNKSCSNMHNSRNTVQLTCRVDHKQSNLHKE